MKSLAIDLKKAMPEILLILTNETNMKMVEYSSDWFTIKTEKIRLNEIKIVIFEKQEYYEFPFLEVYISTDDITEKSVEELEQIVFDAVKEEFELFIASYERLLDEF